MNAAPLTYRQATPDDAPKLAELGREFYLESTFAQFAPYSGETVLNFVKGLTLSPAGVVILAECEGEVVGFIGGALAPNWFSGTTVANELAWWVHSDFRNTTPAGMRLLDKFEQWARDNNAHLVCMSDISLLPSPAPRILEKRGYALAERAHLKALA